MKNRFCIMLFLVVSNSLFAQQFLWSTAQETSGKHISINDVNDEVLKFFNHYRNYKDDAGYDKENFIKQISKFGDKSEGWNKLKNEIQKIDKLTVFAMRTNSGQGSEVMVIFVTKNNVNVITFSNSYERNSVIIIKSQSDKFIDWLETLKE